WRLSAGAAGAAVPGATVPGIRRGLPPADPPPPPPEATPQPSPVAAPEPTAAAAVRRAAVRRAIAEYRSRESLVGKHQMTCDDLARGLADVDDQWLHYTPAAPGGGSGPADPTRATPRGTRAGPRNG